MKKKISYPQDFLSKILNLETMELTNSPYYLSDWKTGGISGLKEIKSPVFLNENNEKVLVIPFENKHYYMENGNWEINTTIGGGCFSLFTKEERFEIIDYGEDYVIYKNKYDDILRKFSMEENKND